MNRNRKMQEQDNENRLAIQSTVSIEEQAAVASAIKDIDMTGILSWFRIARASTSVTDQTGKKKPAAPSDEQIEMLLLYLKKNAHLIFPQISFIYFEPEWKHIALKLNQIPGVRWSPYMWSEFWSALGRNALQLDKLSSLSEKKSSTYQTSARGRIVRMLRIQRGEFSPDPEEECILDSTTRVNEELPGPSSGPQAGGSQSSTFQLPPITLNLKKRLNSPNERQKDLLIRFIEQNPYLCADYVPFDYVRDIWNDIARKLNKCRGGTYWKAKRWQQYWIGRRDKALQTDNNITEVIKKTNKYQRSRVGRIVKVMRSQANKFTYQISAPRTDPSEL